MKSWPQLRRGMLPGGYIASGTATSSLPGVVDPRHVAAEAFTYGVPTAG